MYSIQDKLNKAQRILQEKYSDREYWIKRLSKSGNDSSWIINAIKTNAQETELEIEVFETYINDLNNLIKQGAEQDIKNNGNNN